MASNEPPKYEPLRITAHLRTAVVGDEWLPLDGLLLYQHVRADLGERAVTTPGASGLAQPKGEPMRGGRLPLAYVHGKEWYYRCSWAEWGPHTDGRDYWNKRFDQSLAYLVDFQGRRGRIDTSAADYKAYHMPIFYRSALWVRWYCVGDPERLRPLLYMCTHIGKKTSQGWGRVARWEIEPCDADWSVWRDGRLMRGIPLWDLPRGVRAEDVGRIGYYGMRPPYWDNRNQIEVVLPL